MRAYVYICKEKSIASNAYIRQFGSVTQSCPSPCDPTACSTPGSPVPSPAPGACSKSCPSSQWCHPTVSSSVVPLFACLQASGSFLMSVFFVSGGQNWSFSFSISLSNKYSGLISFRIIGLTLQSKDLSRVFSNTTVQRHQFLSAQLSLWANSHIHTWPLEKP